MDVRKVFDAIAKKWNLSQEQATSLLADDDSRIGLLLGIYKNMHICFGEPLADLWLTRHNTGRKFSGLSPVEYMIQNGEDGILFVLKLTSSWAVGNH